MMNKNATLFSTCLLLALSPPPPAVAHGGVVNVTRLLLDHADHNFGTFASLLAASGLEDELEARQRHRGGGASAGITVFAPSDISFAQADPRAVAWLLHAASPDDRLAVLRAHVAADWLSLPELRTAAPRPVQPTLATVHDGGAGGGITRFTLNVTGSGEDGPVMVSSGTVETQVDDTLLDGGGKRAVAVFSVLDVLFPKEFVSP